MPFHIWRVENVNTNQYIQCKTRNVGDSIERKWVGSILFQLVTTNFGEIYYFPNFNNLLFYSREQWRVLYADILEYSRAVEGIICRHLRIRKHFPIQSIYSCEFL